MIIGSSYKDKYIINRSFRFLSPGINNPDSLLKKVDYDLETSFFSTAVGDNIFINSLPGFGFNTDPSPAIINTNGAGSGIKNNLGNLGRYHKRIFNDNASVLTLTACVPEFTGIIRYLVNMFDYASSLATNKGRAPHLSFYIGQAASSIAFYPFQLIGLGMNFLAFLNDSPKNSWYTAKPAMGIYLSAAQGIFNDFMVNAGYALTVLDKETKSQGNEKRGAYDTGTLSGYNADNRISARESDLGYMNALYPDAINKNGTIDIATIVGRGARKYRHFLKQVKNLDNSVTRVITPEEKDKEIENILNNLVKDPEFLNGKAGSVSNKKTMDYLNAELDTVAAYRGPDEISSPEIASSYYDQVVAKEVVPNSVIYGQENNNKVNISKVQDIVNKYQYKTGSGAAGVTTTAAAPNGAGDATRSGSSTSGDNQLSGNIVKNEIDVNSAVNQTSWMSTIYELTNDMFLGGMDAISWRVEGATGPVSDSFSNSTQQSEISGFFNGTVQAVNNFKFNTQGGATGIDLIDGIISRVKDAAVGVASGSVIGNIPLALMGNSKMHIPEYWADSQTNLHTESFEIYCESLYAHPYSIATQVFLPLSLLLPFVLPAATGGSTYTSPFICKAFCQGRTVIKTGIVKSASFTFGEGELGFTKDRVPRNFRCRLEIADLDSVLAMPVVRIKNALEVFNATGTSSKYLGDIGKYNDFMARMTGQDYLATTLKYERLNRAITRFKNDFTQIFSPANVVGAIADSPVSDIARIFTQRPLNR